MASYEFRTSHIPGVVIADDRPGHVSYALSTNRQGFARWGGVIEKRIASELKPWARPVRFGFTAYRVASLGDWQELQVGEYLWGCMLQGPGSLVVVFALLENGLPVIGSSRR